MAAMVDERAALKRARRQTSLARTIGILTAIALGVVLPFVATQYQTFQLTTIMIYATSLLGMMVLMGRAGLLSFGQGGFVAIGAYATAILMTKANVPYLPAIVLGGLVAFGVGATFGFPAIRLSHVGLTIMTLGVALVLPQLIKRYKDLTGGFDGISLPMVEPSFGVQLSWAQWVYYVALGFLLLMMLICWSLLHGRIGRAWSAMRDHEIAAAAMGVNVPLYKGMAFAFSALFGGVAGGLYALAFRFVSPESFPFFLSITLVVAIVVGGSGSIVGALLGGVFVVYTPIAIEAVLPATSVNPNIVYGLLVVVMMWLAPQGLVGIARPIWRLLRGRSHREG